MHRFKLPLIVTGVALVLAIILGVVIITSIHGSRDSSRRKQERAAQAGGAVAVGVCVVVAPFWFWAAAKVGKERRAAREREARALNRRRG